MSGARTKILLLCLLITHSSISIAGVSSYTSWFRANPVFIPANGKSACTISIYIKDESGNGISGKSPTISAQLQGTSIIQPGITDSNGMCTGYVKSTKLGGCTITVSCDGVMVKENYILNPSFEYGTGIDAYNWAENYGSPTTHTRNSEKAHGSSSWSLKSLNTVQSATLSDQFSVTPYTYYKVSGWMYNALSSGNQYYDMDDSQLEDPASEDLSLFSTRGASTWEYKEGVWYSAGLVKRRLRCVTDGSTSGACWFDNVRVERLPTVQFTGGRIKITCGPMGTTINNPGPGIGVEVQDLEGNVDTTDSGSAVLQTSSPTGKFSIDRSNWQDTYIIYFSSGVAGFHYKDSTPGNYTITVSRPGVLESDTVIISVLEPSPYESACIISSPFSMAPATGTDSITIVVSVRDTFEYPVSGVSVTLSTYRGESITFISANPQISDSNGLCTWTISSLTTGSDTIFFNCGSGLFSNIYFDGFSHYTEGTDGSPNWKVHQGVWKVTGGTYLGRNSGDDGWFAVGASGGDINWKDCTINLKFKIASFGSDWRDSARIGFRYQDNNNGYTLEFINGYDWAWISKKSQGVSTGDPGTNPPLSINYGPVGHRDGNWHRVCLRLESNRINILFDGKQLFNVVDSNYRGVPPLYYGKIMLSAHDYTGDSLHNTKVYYDEIQVSPFTVRFTGIADHIGISTKGMSAGNAGLITFEVQDTQNYRVTSFNGTATISTSSPSGRFSLNRDLWIDTSIVVLQNGMGRIYYFDSTPGTHTATIICETLKPGTASIPVLQTPACNTPTLTLDQTHYLYCNLGGTNENNGVTQVDVFPGDGATVSTSMGGVSCRMLNEDLPPEYNNKYMYFDIFDGYIYNNIDSKWTNILIGVRYYDNGTGSIYLEYDGQSDTFEQCPMVLQLQNTNQWKNTCFVIENPRFANRQWCGTDFRLYCPEGNMYISRVTVHRAPGQNIGPGRDLTGEASFTQADKLLITSNFFDWWIFDSWNPLGDRDKDIYPGSPAGYGVHPAGLHPSDPARVDYNAGGGIYSRCKSLAKRLIRDAILAGFDIIKPNYCGQSRDAYYLVWIKGIVSALEELEQEGYINSSYRIPKVAQFIETYFSGEDELEYSGQKLDCTTERGKAILYDKIRDFWSMIPSKWWAMVNDQPLIFIYENFDVAASDQSTFDYIGKHFKQDFGKKPYILVGWGGLSSNDTVSIEYWHWGCGQTSAPELSYMTPGVGSHYHDIYCRPSPRGGIRDPMNGEWFRVGLETDGSTKRGMWDKVLEHMLNNPGKHKICVTSFNEMAEGSGIQDSAEFGRKDLKDLAFYKRMWKCNPVAYKFSDLTSFSPGELRAQLSFAETPPSAVKPGQEFPVKILIKNNGSVGWCNYTFHGPPNNSRGVVRLGCKQPVNAFAKMQYSMAPGDTQILVLNLIAPESEGIYTFKFDMHNYGHSNPWFTDSDPGNSTLDAVINVSDSGFSPPGQPSFTKIETSTGAVTFSWTAEQGSNPVKGYYVYYRVDPETQYYFLDDFSRYGEIKIDPAGKGNVFPIWQVQDGEWTVKTKDVFGYNWVNVNNGVLEGVNSGNDDSAPSGIITGDPCAADYTVQFRFKIIHIGTDSGDGVRVGFRFQDSKNCYVLEILPKTASNNIRLIKIKDGNVSTPATYFRQLYESGITWWNPLYSQSFCYKSWQYDIWHTVKIKVEGAQITVWFDGDQIISYNDSTPLQKGRIVLSARRHGFATQDTHILFDDFKIEPVSQNTWFLLATTSETTVSYSGIVEGKDFSFKVCAFDSAGNTGPFSSVWTTAIPTRIVIASPPFYAVKGSPSTPVIVEVRSSGNRLIQTYEGTATLSSSSPAGRFSIDKDNWIDTTIVYISAGTASFYYRDTQTGYPVITVSGEGLESGTQTGHIFLSLARPHSPAGFRLEKSGNDIILKWDRVLHNEDGSLLEDLAGYRLFRSRKSGGPYVQISTPSASDTICIDTGSANTSYYYVLSAMDSDQQEGAYSFELDSSGNVVVRRPYFESTGDSITSLFIPANAAGVLYKDGNPSNESMRIKINEITTDRGRKIPGGEILYSFEFVACTSESNIPHNLSFSPHKLNLKMHYRVADGYIEGTAIPVDQVPRVIAIFYWNGLEWIKVGSILNSEEQSLSIQTEHLSKYAIVRTVNAQKLTLTKRVPPIITPNGDGINDAAFFYLENPNNVGISCRIYDLHGKIVQDFLPGGPVSNSFKWDGRDSNGDIVESGIYIYQIQSSEAVLTGSIVVSK